MEQTQIPPRHEEALLEAINRQRAQDPLIGAKLGAEELLSKLVKALEKKTGAVHIESLLCMLGSLGGFACHMTIQEALIETGKVPENKAFIIVKGNDGRNYYFGDLVNKPLLEDQLSFWSLVAGEASHLSVTNLPDIRGTISRVTSTVGTDKFGKIDLPGINKPSTTPLKYIKVLWPQVTKVLNKYCVSPEEKPILIGLATQKAIGMGKDIIAPKDALLLVMESAISMSKISLEWL